MGREWCVADKLPPWLAMQETDFVYSICLGAGKRYPSPKRQTMWVNEPLFHTMMPHWREAQRKLLRC